MFIYLLVKLNLNRNILCTIEIGLYKFVNKFIRYQIIIYILLIIQIFHSVLKIIYNFLTIQDRKSNFYKSIN